MRNSRKKLHRSRKSGLIPGIDVKGKKAAVQGSMGAENAEEKTRRMSVEAFWKSGT